MGEVRVCPGALSARGRGACARPGAGRVARSLTPSSRRRLGARPTPCHARSPFGLCVHAGGCAFRARPAACCGFSGDTAGCEAPLLRASPCPYAFPLGCSFRHALVVSGPSVRRASERAPPLPLGPGSPGARTLLRLFRARRPLAFSPPRSGSGVRCGVCGWAWASADGSRRRTGRLPGGLRGGDGSRREPGEALGGGRSLLSTCER